MKASMNTGRTLFNIFKMVGNNIADAMVIRNYRITVMIERKIDEKQAIVIDSVVIDRPMSTIQVNDIVNRIKHVLNIR